MNQRCWREGVRLEHSFKKKQQGRKLGMLVFVWAGTGVIVQKSKGGPFGALRHPGLDLDKKLKDVERKDATSGRRGGWKFKTPKTKEGNTIR